MALWNKVQTLSQESLQQVYSLYGEVIPIEVRNLFATSIEDAVCGSGLDPENPSHTQNIAKFLSTLVEQLESRGNDNTSADPFYIRHKLRDAATFFKEKYGGEPLALFRIIRECIQVEQSLVKQEEYPGLYDKDEIMESLQAIKEKINKTGEILKGMSQELEAFALNCNEQHRLDGVLRQVSGANSRNETNAETQAFEKTIREKKLNVEEELLQNLRKIMQFMVELERNIAEDITKLTELQDKVIQEQLLQWKFEQQQAGNGVPSTINLDRLQRSCEDLAELIWTTRQQIKEAERLKRSNPVFVKHRNNLPPDTIPGLNDKVKKLLEVLLSSTFVVENQPPQVMKLTTKFPSVLTTRLLIGNRLNILMTSPQVTALIISEGMAKSIVNSDKIEKSGEIVNGVGKLEFHPDTKQVTANFRNLQLKKIARAEKKGAGAESVMEEKFCLYFVSQITVGELNFKIWTLSLPVVVISHGSQEAQALATITWDNAFGEISRIPFQVPANVTWSELSQVLDSKFKSVTGRGLTEDNLSFLAQKALRNNFAEHITWSQFCKDNLPERNFTFWDWFHAAMRLIEKYLKGPWGDGIIMGFIEREAAENMLQTCIPGTFLIRFSDSLLGAITIAWIHTDGERRSARPFECKDLKSKALADCINDIDKIQYLYPNIPKGDAFGKYYKPVTQTPRGRNPYVEIRADLDVPVSPLTTPQIIVDAFGFPNSCGAPVSPAVSEVSHDRLMETFQAMDNETSASGFDWSHLLTFASTPNNDLNLTAHNNISSHAMDMDDDIVTDMVMAALDNVSYSNSGSRNSSITEL